METTGCGDHARGGESRPRTCHDGQIVLADDADLVRTYLGNTSHALEGRAEQAGKQVHAFFHDAQSCPVQLLSD
jgi:hypothetical protein